MAAVRRLSELLQEQQEPFLVEVAKGRRPRRGRGGSGSGDGSGGGGAGLGCCSGSAAATCRRLLRLCNHGFKKRKSGVAGVGSGLRSALSKVLCSRAMRRVLRWEDLDAGCFSGAGAGCGREFRRLRRSLGDSGECDPRAMVFAEDDAEEERMGWKADMDVDSSRQLSPVSVLDLHSDDDEESPLHSHWEDEKPSTSGSSPPSESFLGPASPCFSFSCNLHDKFCEMEVDDPEEETVRASRSIEQQISSWEKIAGDISRIPAMMELDLSRSMRQWREMEPEVREIGARIETLIFEDIRSEAVCDMLASHCTLAAAATSC
ncbi:hypothetical protein GQ55_9G133500 [Panicum hallii var. hallii]|uniref:DUF4378 domain-containing protein n=1 Tax=Panicum hallii var. hallii TaxID=1504633 RepID=A0A2T7C2P1_9POAL|nr:hypothetical protein GQ55_9G133500 [Panicum hallii var. hallii]